jgi:protoheme IX farnesyltransferase
MSTVNATPVSAERSAAAVRAGAVLARLSDYLELTKPRIVILELFVAAAAACLAGRHALDVAVVLHALAGTALVAASASIANQWLERASDARMRRTAERPLVAGRVASSEALALTALTLAAGAAWLLMKVNGLTAALGVATWIIYALVYTPLKTRSPLNTTVGAVAGAIPVLMGWTATSQPLNLTALSLAGVLFLWQFPHFMAIAWLYRRDYAAAGHQMLSVVDPTGIRAGRQAIAAALALIPVSLIPALAPTSGSPVVYSLWAIALGGVQLALAARFALNRDESSARLLLRATLIYLPAWLAVMLMVSV